MDLMPALKKLEESPDFAKWREKNRHTYLSYAFRIPQEMSDWQLGYYNRDKDRITTFIVSSESIGVRPEEEMFKEQEKDVNEIRLHNVKLSFESVLAKASEFQGKNYPKDSVLKTIAILQNTEKLGDVWNITYITEAFNTLNMKIDASTGSVMEHRLSSIFEFRQK